METNILSLGRGCGMLSKIAEALGLRKTRSTIYPLGSSLYEYPKITFRDYVEAYERDPDVAASIDFLTHQIVGPGFHTESVDPDAKNLIDDFNRRVGMDVILFNVVRELVLAGNSFLQPLREEGVTVGLRPFTLTSITRARLDKSTGRVLSYIYLRDGVEEEIPGEDLIHFSWNKIDSQVFGSGMLRPLLEPRPINYRDKTFYSSGILYIKWRMEWIMQRLLEKYVTRTIYQFKDVGDEELSENVIPKLNQLEPGQDFVTNREVEVKEVKIDPRAKFEAYIEYLHNEILAGLRTPVVKLFTTPGFTEASARAAVEAAEHHVRAIQRYVKRVVEDKIFTRLLVEHGFDPASSAVKLNWGIPERPTLRFSDIHAAYASGGISREEYRKLLRSMGWPLQPDENKA